MDKENKLTDFDRLDCESEFTKAVPQIIMASDGNPNGVFLHIEQRAYIAKELAEQGYRKMEEVTLKLDLGDRTPEEIKQITEQLREAMSTTPIPVISLSDNEIGKKVTKEIFEMLIFWTQNQKTWGKTIDIDELIQCLQQFAREKGVEIK